MSGFPSLHGFGFGSPNLLWALLVVPPVIVFASAIRRRRSRYAVTYSNLRVLAGALDQGRGRWSRHTHLALLVLALALAAMAFARPRIRTVDSSRSTTIVLLVDVSDSMSSSDIYPMRLRAAATAMHGFVNVLPKNDEVGLVTFSDRVEILDGPTADRSAIAAGLNSLEATGGTALGDGIAAAVRIIVSTLGATGTHRTPGQYLPAAIVLESDGAQNRGATTPLAAAELAKAAGVRIYGVALGTRDGFITEGAGILKVRVNVPPDRGTVAMLARETGGQAYNATNAGNLNSVYRNLGTSIGRREGLTEITSWFELAAGIALVCAIAVTRIQSGALP